MGSSDEDSDGRYHNKDRRANERAPLAAVYRETGRQARDTGFCQEFKLNERTTHRLSEQSRSASDRKR